MPGFILPGRVDRVILPCAGRLQPEHLLKAFESGCHVVAVVACEEGNCHHAEGSRRCTLRVGYVRSLLEKIGLGEGRLVLAHLPGSALEDLDVSEGRPAAGTHPDDLAARIEGIRKEILEALGNSPPNPLARPSSCAPAGGAPAEAPAPGGRAGHE
ncbi:MAG: hydrogenase iron-sulfur subunit [Acidobacteria bacterium]|nr:hydrogenase iron-sulfur subunit [Acidobacteriota bacterium]